MLSNPGLATGKAGQQIPLLIPQHKLLSGSQILHQIGLVNKTPGIQQIITHTSQPTIITQVSQATGQPISQMVAKVSCTASTDLSCSLHCCQHSMWHLCRFHADSMWRLYSFHTDSMWWLYSFHIDSMWHLYRVHLLFL